LKARKAAGPAPKLNGEQLRRLYRIIAGNNPLQLGFEFVLWTRAMIREVIREVIREQFGVRQTDVSVGRLLRKLGLSPQRPPRHPSR
jgi:transposase